MWGETGQIFIRGEGEGVERKKLRKRAQLMDDELTEARTEGRPESQEECKLGH